MIFSSASAKTGAFQRLTPGRAVPRHQPICSVLLNLHPWSFDPTDAPRESCHTGYRGSSEPATQPASLNPRGNSEHPSRPPSCVSAGCLYNPNATPGLAIDPTPAAELCEQKLGNAQPAYIRLGDPESFVQPIESAVVVCSQQVGSSCLGACYEDLGSPRSEERRV